MLSSILLKRVFSTTQVARCISKNANGGRNLVDKIAVTDDGKMFVAWHPNVEFPYEFSIPIPSTSQVESTTLLKEKALSSAMSAFKGKHPEVSRQELMNLTYTTKHRWFPRSRDKKAKKTPMDRPYL